MGKRILASTLALFTALGLIAPNASALSGGNISCDSLKSTLTSDSSETGSVIMVLTEDCVANLTIKSGQSITIDAAGHNLSSASGATITVEEGGELTLASYSEPGTVRGGTVIKNSGTANLTGGNVLGNIETSAQAKTTITGGAYSVDPAKYVPEGYAVKNDNNLYTVAVVSADNALFDTSKITSSDASLKKALVETLNKYIASPDTSSLNGRMLAQLVNAINRGHTLSVSLDTNDNPDLTEDLLQLLLTETAGANLASVSDINFTVTDTTDSTLSVSLVELASPVTVKITIPNQYKAQLATRKVNVLHIHSEDDNYSTSQITGVRFDSNGDLTFETSTFSLFAMTYDDAPITASVSDGDIAVPATSAATVASANVTTPDTAGFFGIELTVFNLLMVSAIMLVLSVFIAYAIKRAYIRRKISLK